MDTSPILAEPLSHLEILTAYLRQLPAQTLQNHEDDVSPRILPGHIPPFPSHSLPMHGLPSTASLLSHLTSRIVPYLSRSSLSPNYYGFVTGGATPAAAAGDILASIYDQNVAVHLPQQSIATSVEVVALNMLLDLFHLPRRVWGVGRQLGLPPGTNQGRGSGSGTFTTGATASNIVGLALGREWVISRAASRVKGKPISVAESGLMSALHTARLTHIQILSTMPHSSTIKAASILGIGRSNIISLSNDDSSLTIDLEKLKAHLSTPHVASILSVSTGEVNTGHFATSSWGQMQSIRALCDSYGAWIHVDGAFGLFGRILASSTQASAYQEIINGTAGLELADSITGDAHKLLNVPYDCGFFFTRHKDLAQEVFRNGDAPYLAPFTDQFGDDDGVQSPLDIGIENSRRFRAMPVYATLLAYGRMGYVEMLERQVGLARRVAGWLDDHAAYELLPSDGGTKEEVQKRTFMIVLFRARHVELNRVLVQKINVTGRIYVTGTRWDGQPAARIAVSNWQVDVERDGKLIEEVLTDVLEEFETAR